MSDLKKLAAVFALAADIVNALLMSMIRFYFYKEKIKVMILLYFLLVFSSRFSPHPSSCKVV